MLIPLLFAPPSALVAQDGGGVLLSAGALQAIDDVPHTGGFLGARVPLTGSISLDPRVGVGQGEDHLAWQAQATLTWQQPLGSRLRGLLGAGYGIQGERATGDRPDLDRRASGPVGALGLRWMFTTTLGLDAGVRASRIRFAGDGDLGSFSADTAQMHLGFVLGRGG